MREFSIDRTYIKMKIDALAWHARCLPVLKSNQVLDALTLFKNSVLPNDKPQVRNAYIKMMDHGSNAIVQLTNIIKAESLQEKMTVNGPTSMKSSADGRVSGMGMNQDYDDRGGQNAHVQRRLYQLLSIAEPLLLNDENVVKAINSSFIDLLSDMLLFQNSNLNNIQKKINMNDASAKEIHTPQYLKVLMRCLTSMLRNEATVETLLSHLNCRPLMAIVGIMKFSREEELVANGLKIIRYSIRDETHHQKTILEFPDMINQIIQSVYINFDDSIFVNGEMKNILNSFTRKKDYVYLIKPDSIAVLARHPSGIVKQFPVLDQISMSYIVSQNQQ